MKKNVGTTDQIIRFIVAFLTLTMYLADYINGWLALVLLITMMATALSNFCPLYSLLNITTIKSRKRRH